MASYLDNNATTPLHDEVFAAMQPHMQLAGNASSLHRYGRVQRDAIEQARQQVAALVDARPEQVVFTSGGTEANNLAIKGVAAKLNARRVAISATEHMSVIEPAQSLIAAGCALDMIGVDAAGRVNPDHLQQCLRADTALVSVMAANNETGVLQDIATLAAMARERGIWFHSDASQAAGKLELSFAKSGAHAMTLSAHKLYGPQGAGALIIDSRLPITAILHGGAQEKRLRAGTENVAAIAGFGKAAELAARELEMRAQHTQTLRDALEVELRKFSTISIFAEHAQRLPNTTQFGVAGFDGETLLMQLDRKGIAVSSGSACTSGKTEPSHVLKAMGVEREYALGAVRVSFGMQNCQQDVHALLQALRSILQMSHSPVMAAALA
jgi:cysteine desulfurase